MSNPPEVRHHLILRKEMDALFTENRFETKLQSCRKEAIEQERTNATMLHETFCCKKEVFRFFDPDTDDEIALIAQYTKELDRSNDLIVCRLRIGDDIYDLKLT
jgi:hypothetical protein